MKSNKISMLAAGTALLLAAGLLSGCAGQLDGEEEQSKEVMVEPILNEGTAIDPIATIEETERIDIEGLEGLEGIEPIESIEDILGGIPETTDKSDVTIDAISEATDAMLAVDDANIEIAQDLVAERGMETETAASAVINDAAEVVVLTPEIIHDIQQALVDAGFNPGPVDGFSGPRTLNAIKSFQAQNNLAVGQVTKETLRALNVDY